MLERDAGVYEAIATNPHGEARQPVILKIAEHPRFLSRPEETTVMERDQARFEAKISGVPTPTVSQRKGPVKEAAVMKPGRDEVRVL